MRNSACATATTAFFGPRWRSTRRKRACRALFLARLAPAAASINAVRSQRLPFRVLPDRCLPRTLVLARTECGPAGEMPGAGERSQVCPHLREDDFGRPLVDPRNGVQPT